MAAIITRLFPHVAIVIGEHLIDVIGGFCPRMENVVASLEPINVDTVLFGLSCWRPRVRAHITRSVIQVRQGCPA